MTCSKESKKQYRILKVIFAVAESEQIKVHFFICVVERVNVYRTAIDDFPSTKDRGFDGLCVWSDESAFVEQCRKAFCFVVTEISPFVELSKISKESW